MKYHEAIEWLKDPVQRQDLISVGVRCGNILEAVLQHMLEKTMTRATAAEVADICKVREQIKPQDNFALFVLGEYIRLFRSAKVFEIGSRFWGRKLKKAEHIEWDEMRRVRNNCSHGTGKPATVEEVQGLRYCTLRFLENHCDAYIKEWGDQISIGDTEQPTELPEDTKPKEKEPDTVGRGPADARFEQAVRTGRLTPFLGPMCFGPLECSEAAVEHVRARLARLEKRLSRETERRYAKTVVASKMSQAVKGTSQRPGALESMPGLLDLQAALTCTGVAVCRALGKEMARSAEGTTDASTYTVNPSRWHGGALRANLFECCHLAEALEEHDHCMEAGHPCFGATRVKEKLFALAWCIFKDDARVMSSRSGRAWLKQSPRLAAKMQELAPQQVTGPQVSRVSLAQFEWLGDLLWHSFRFDAPLFPDSQDLAFRLSLCTRDALPRRVRSEVAAGACHITEDCIPSLYGYYHSRVRQTPPNRVGLLGAVARVLWHAASLSERVTTTDMEDVPTAEGSVEDILVPMAAITSLDAEFERVLEDANRPYGVLIPVTAEEPPPRKSTDPEKRKRPARPATDRQTQGTRVFKVWLLASVPPGGSHRETRWFCVPPKMDMVEFAEWFSRNVEGPLLVKLRGSPLHDLSKTGSVRVLPAADDSGTPTIDGDSKLTHRILLSDYDFFQMMLDERRYPDCVAGLLKEDKRVLCFLGYPLDDSGSVFRLHRHVRDGGKKLLGEQFLVDHPRDVFRHAALDELRVTTLLSPLDEVVSLVDNIPHLISLYKEE